MLHLWLGGIIYMGDKKQYFLDGAIDKADLLLYLFWGSVCVSEYIKLP